MTFLPQGPIGQITLGVLLFCAAMAFVSRVSAARTLAMIAALNWAGTRAVTAWGAESAVMSAMVDFASFALVAALVRSMVKWPYCALYVFMLASYAGAALGWINGDQMWAAVDVFGYAQFTIILGLAAGGLLGGGGHRRADGRHGSGAAAGPLQALTAARDDIARRGANRGVAGAAGALALVWIAWRRIA